MCEISHTESISEEVFPITNDDTRRCVNLCERKVRIWTTGGNVVNMDMRERAQATAMECLTARAR